MTLANGDCAADALEGYSVKNRLVISLGIVIAAATLGWIELWYFAAARASQALETAMQRERESGRHWNCRELTRSGFPFALNLRCAGLTFTSNRNDQPINGSIPAINATFSVLRPGRINFEIASPAQFNLERPGTAGSFKWNKLSASIALRSFKPRQLQLSGESLEADIKSPAQDHSYRAASLILSLNDLEALRDPAVPALGVKATLRQLAVPQLDIFTEDNSPALVELSGQIIKPATLLGKSSPPQERVADWSSAGGVLDIQDFALLKDVFQFSIRGGVSIDQLGFPEGRLIVGASGVSNLLRRFGVPQASLAIEGALGRLARRRPDTREDRPPQMPVPVVLRNGRVYFGPVQTQIRLPRLY